MQIDPVDLVLSRLRNPRKVGDGKYMASSPLRRDSNPSLSVRRGDDGRCLLNDHGGGTTEEIVAALGLTMGDLFADDRPQRREWRPMEKPKRVYAKPQPKAVEGVGPGALQWFAGRGIPREIVERFGVYTEAGVSFDVGGGTWERLTALCFPYTREGVRVNVKFRAATGKHFKMFADGEPCFWGADDVAKDATLVYLVEGELDRMALAAAGVDDAISPPNGCKSLTEEVMASAKHLFDNDRIRFVLAGDMDEKGEEMMRDFAHRVGKERCLRVRWPEGCKDANDALVKHGDARVRECLAAAEPIPVDGIISVVEASGDLWRMYDEGLPPGFSTGSAALDRNYTVKPGYFTVVTGSSGSGKSTFLDWMYVNMAELHDWSFALCSFENRIPRHIASLAAKYVRKPFRDGFRERMSVEELAHAEEWVGAHFGFVQPKQPTLDEILAGVRALVYQKGARCAVIDPWNRIVHDDSMNNGDMVARVYARVADFVSRYDFHIHVVAHPTKLPKQANGTYPVAQLGDISGSINHWNMPDYGLSVYRHRNDPTKPAEIHVLKARHDEVATEGVVFLNFDRATGRYYDPDEPVAAVAGTESLMAWRPPVSRYHGEEEDAWDGAVQDRPPVDLAALASSYAAADGGD